MRLLVAAEPSPTGDGRFDALLAAIAEDVCVHASYRRRGFMIARHDLEAA